MIKVNELRVGNSLKRNGIVVTIDARSIFDIWDKSKEYEPIPLTHELLEKCGFESKLPDFEGWLRLDAEIPLAWNGSEILMGADDDFRYLPHIKYLHQLQNLYYSLTGEEINITL